MKKLYIAVSKDEYELPIAVADTPTELARMVGVSRKTIYNQLNRSRHGKIKQAIYKAVEVDDE